MWSNLYQLSAKEFLTNQLGVDVHSIEVDVHPMGKDIRKYVMKKTGHKTTPVIFIKGQYLGGFEEVNNLYSSGDLEKKYLKGISQAEQCELMIADSKSAIKPLFWFPDKVNGKVVRITGVLTCLASAISAAFHWKDWGAYIAYGILLDFVLRLFAGARASPLGRLAAVLALPLEPQPRAGRPKQFASMCGLMFSFFGSLFFILNFPGSNIIGAFFMGGLAIATGMEGFLDFCLGCFFFRIGMELGLIPK